VVDFVLQLLRRLRQQDASGELRMRGTDNDKENARRSDRRCSGREGDAAKEKAVYNFEIQFLI